MNQRTRYETRLTIHRMAMEGVVIVTIARQNGTRYKVPVTLLQNSRECATINADLYYESIGTTRAKARREKKKNCIERVKTWQEIVAENLNMMHVVDAMEFRWIRIPLNRIVDFDWED